LPLVAAADQAAMTGAEFDGDDFLLVITGCLAR